MHRRTSLPLVALFVMICRIVPASADPSAAAAPHPLDAATRARVLEGLYQNVGDHYVEPDTAKMLVDAVRRREEAGAYDALTDPVAFAEAVTRDLRSVNHDLHLSLRYTAPGAPAPGGGMRRIVVAPGGPGAAPDGPHAGQPTADFGGMDESFIREARSKNFGLTKVEVLPGNIGYLEVTGFMGVPGSDEAVAAALRFLERTDAVIVDLRQNPGGSGQMSDYLMSHFLPATPVNTVKVKSRESAEPVILQSIADVAGPRRTDVPLYVLTSRGTGSAAEAFSFVLKNQGRATLVGEPTSGGSHMVNFFPLGDGFSAGVSITRVSDPRTGAEWEGIGVQPDVRVPADDALTTAQLAALRVLRPKASDDRQRRRYDWAMAWVEAQAGPASLEPARAAALVGRYEGERSVTLSGGRLMFTRGPRAAIPLAPLRDGWFGVTPEIRITFADGPHAASMTEERLDGTRSSYARESDPAGAASKQ
jgi:hypothetical protein